MDRINTATDLGFNVASSAYWHGHRCFLNMMFDAGYNIWQNDNGWPATGPSPNFDPATNGVTNLPPGHKVGRVVKLSMSRVYGWCKPGRYVARSTAGGTLRLRAPKANVQVVSEAVNRCEFIVLADDPPGTEFGITVDNTTGRPLAFGASDVKVCEAANEALLEAGELWHPDFLAMLQGAKAIRSLDFCGTHGDGREPVWKVPAQVYTPENYAGGSPVPPEYFADLCRRVGAKAWVTLPIPMDQVSFSASAATNEFRIRDINRTPLSLYRNGDVVFFTNDAYIPFPERKNCGPYYVVEASGGSFKLADTRDGKAKDVVFDANESLPESWQLLMSKFYEPLDLWNAIISRMHAAAPGITIQCEAGNETWNSRLPYVFQIGYERIIARWMCEGRPPATSAGAAAQGHAYTSLLAWKAVENHYPRRQSERIYGSQIWWGNTGPGIDLRDPGVIARGEPVHDLMDAAAVTCYLQPCHDKANQWGEKSGYSAQQLLDERAEDWDTATMERKFRNCIDGVTEIHLKAWRRELDSRRPGLPISYYEGGNHCAYDFRGTTAPYGARAEAIHRRLTKFWFGPEGDAFRKEWKIRCFDAWRVKQLNYFILVGFWSTRAWNNDGGMTMWGSAWREGLPDNSLQTWLKASFRRN